MEAASLQPSRLSPRLEDLAARAAHEARLKAARFRWDPITGLQASGSSPQPSDPRPLNVLVTKGGKSLFRFMKSDRVRVFWPGEPVAAAPDLVVTTLAMHLADDPWSLELPQEVWLRLQSGAAKLVFDCCGEGVPHDPKRIARLHGFLHEAGVSPSDCVYLTQDRGFRAEYLARRAGLGPGEAGMEVWVHDRYIQQLCAAVRAGDGEAVFHRRLNAYAAAPAQRERRFVCLNNKLVYAHRLLFLLRLLRDGLWPKGHISLGDPYEFDGKILNQGQFLKRIYATTELQALADELTPLLDRLRARSPRRIGLGDADLKGPPSDAMVVPQMYEEYSSSWFSVVIETEPSNRLHRITEKPFKPLLCFHPLIVLGSCGSLRLIREYGFETYPGLFDEGYDQETDLRTRFDMVYDQVARLCRMDEAELARSCEAAAETVVFNACWGLTQLPRLFRLRIDGALIDRLAAFARQDGAGRAQSLSRSAGL